MNHFIFTDDYYHSVLSESLDSNRISEVLLMQHKFQYWGYIALPFVLLIKLGIVSGVIFSGCYLYNQQVSYKHCLKIVVLAEIISLIAILVKVAWLLMFSPTKNNIQFLSPLSVFQLIDINSIPKYLIYPLQLINLFEVFYWFLLAFGIKSFIKIRLSESFKIVASSYGSALFFWTILVIFIQIEFN